MSDLPTEPRRITAEDYYAVIGRNFSPLPYFEYQVDEETDVALVPLTIENAPELFNVMDTSREHLSQFGDQTADKYPTLQSLFESITQPVNPYRERYIIQANDMTVGSINAQPDGDKRTSFTIGYCIGAEFTGRGIATKATRLLGAELLSRAGVKYLNAYTHQDNVASQRVLRRVGFRFSNDSHGDKRFVLRKSWLHD